MPGQLIELIIFAAIALFLVNKLMSILGTTNEEKTQNKHSFFGEQPSLKDVTATAKQEANVIHTRFSTKKSNSKFHDIILEGHEKEVKQGLESTLEKIPSFNLRSFVNSAEIVFNMLIKAAQDGDQQSIEELVDKRYIEEFTKNAEKYQQYKLNSKVHTKISEVYTFGNSVFVKVLFIAMSKTNSSNLHEEWTFSKNSNDTTPNWYLNNIDRPH